MSPTRPRNRRRLTGIAAAALIAATVTPASAAPSATVSPGTVAPGSRVTLTVDGCDSSAARASSRAFGDVSLSPASRAYGFTGSATVYRDAAAGSYPVTFDCGGSGRRVTVTLTISPGAARGGLGGSIDAMSPARIALGGTLAAGALGTGVWLLRRRWAHAR
ncbi:hypothetical protein [Streptomyces sp. W1SF4]|uniref:hypothetical protein n=1 Tax=Streptomyces sp. W1SF4 TaxID=2305220 RepID=UPI000F7073B2|nr:hypothetical protein [Streptomyces sp. W1SF4]AZM89008.1 hypothetical protein D1J60_11330 [Streptomyces sp. W1SF4]